MEEKEWKTIAGWPDYEISRDGQVRKVSTGQILTQWNGMVRLSRSRKDRSFRRVSVLINETFRGKKTYIHPELTDMSEQGEMWKRIEFAPDYMISNRKRVWSWKTCKFVGKRNGSGKLDVLFKDRTMNIDKIYAMHFGYDTPKMDGEDWKESVSPGILVSNFGRLFSTWNLDLMTPQKRPNGYLFIQGRDRRWPVHRLVALAFVRGRDIFRDCIDHINEDKTDNRAVNLRWCSSEENTRFYLENHPGGASKGSAAC